MSIYDYTAAIKITFDRPIISEPNATGWLIQSYQPSMSPGGPLVLTSHTIKRLYKSEDALSVIILLELTSRLKYPVGQVTVTFNGTLLGPGDGAVEPFILSFTPTGIVPVFNPHGPEYVEAYLAPVITVYEITYQYFRSAHEYLAANVNDISIVVTNVGGVPL